jgi:Arc/MetJ-type ribon-helix-helix transcriptional regulator
MKLVTVNVLESHIEAMEKLVGDDGLYPSRCELIRVAIRRFLLKELKICKLNQRRQEKEEKEKKDIDENCIRVPVEDAENPGKPITEFKTYKIIKTLDGLQETTQKKAPKKKSKTLIEKPKRRQRKNHLTNPFWKEKDGYYKSKEDPNLVYIKGHGEMAKDQAIKNNFIEV